jgi:omega-amidase
MAAQRKFTFAACQLLVGKDKQLNVKQAVAAIDEASSKGAHIVCLPECFNAPYSTDAFGPYSEVAEQSFVDGTLAALSQAASRNKVYVVGGSIPERENRKENDENDDRLFNSCFVLGPDGERVARHRKVHLFDIDVPGGVRFKESDTLSAGDDYTCFDTPFGRMGVAICYDLRFWELAASMCRRGGAQFLIYPGAFNTTTGPAHWELLVRSRAVDHQVFVAAVSPARDPDAAYQAHGHSIVVDPWGKVLACTGHDKADILYADIDMSRVDEVRQAIPTSAQRRNEVYNKDY